jgi:hypothetical protein
VYREDPRTYCFIAAVCSTQKVMYYYYYFYYYHDRVCSLLVRVPGYRSRGPGSIPSATRVSEQVVGLERGPLSLVSTIEELLGRKIAALV